MKLERTPFAPHAPHLLELLDALKNAEIPLYLIGGFGLYLRRMFHEQQLTPPLFTVPPMRASEDFDFLIQVSVLGQEQKRKVFREVLEQLGYEPTTKWLQFVKPATATPEARNIKIDLLAPEPDDMTDFKIEYPRLKALKGDHSLHAYVTPEAFEDQPMLLELEGEKTNGILVNTIIYLPHPYALMVLKIQAYYDCQYGKTTKRPKAPDSIVAQKHAVDLYLIVSLMTELEFAQLPNFHERYKNNSIAKTSAQIVHQDFSDLTTTALMSIQNRLGILPKKDLKTFIEVLQTAFPMI